MIAALTDALKLAVTKPIAMANPSATAITAVRLGSRRTLAKASRDEARREPQRDPRRSRGDAGTSVAVKYTAGTTESRKRDRGERGLPRLDPALPLGDRAQAQARERTPARATAIRGSDPNRSTSSRRPRPASSAATSTRVARRAGPERGEERDRHADTEGHHDGRTPAGRCRGGCRRSCASRRRCWRSRGARRGTRLRSRAAHRRARAPTPRRACPRRGPGSIRRARRRSPSAADAPPGTGYRVAHEHAADAEREEGDDREQRDEGGEDDPDHGRRVGGGEHRVVRPEPVLEPVLHGRPPRSRGPAARRRRRRLGRD